LGVEDVLSRDSSTIVGSANTSDASAGASQTEETPHTNHEPVSEQIPQPTTANLAAPTANNDPITPNSTSDTLNVVNEDIDLAPFLTHHYFDYVAGTSTGGYARIHPRSYCIADCVSVDSVLSCCQE
jgi:hypothetical protein